MAHFVAYLDTPHRRVELDAETFNEAQHRAALLLDTRRERSIYLIETSEPKHSMAELIEDTEDTQ